MSKSHNGFFKPIRIVARLSFQLNVVDLDH